jgi:Flp pilus assembly protein TadD
MTASPGRNDICPCGSGKKFKQCCLGRPEMQVGSQTLDRLNNALRIAHVQLAQGNLAQASSLCHHIIQHAPRQPEPWHILAVIELRQGNIDNAIRYLKRALALSPVNPEYLGNMGYALHEKGDLTEAATYYGKALKVDPGYIPALYNQHALHIKGNPKGAVENLTILLKRAPHDNGARFMLAVTLEHNQRDVEARPYLEALAHGSNLDRARLDAWNYLKSACSPLPPITGSMFETFQLALEAAPQEGLLLEFGVRFGNTIRQLAKLTQQKIYGFDSFEGLPEIWHHEPKGSYTTRGEIPKVPGHVELVVGWFDQTLPNFLETHDGPVRLVNVDCDIYSSTKTVLDTLAPRMIPGSVLVFDEYIGNEHWREDEYKAFQEAVARYGWKYEYLCFSVFTKQVAVRITSTTS